MSDKSQDQNQHRLCAKLGLSVWKSFSHPFVLCVLGSINPPSISSVSTEYLEGVPSKVTCEASYTCSKDAPVLTWNFANMPVDKDIKASGSLQKTVSTLTFTASAKDNGKSLTCYATFPGGQTQEKSMTIRVKREYQSQLKFVSFYQD